MRWPCALALIFAVFPATGWAQSEALRGTWSGGWTPESGYVACTVRFALDDDEVRGEMLSPERLEFDHVAFDPDGQRVVAEAETAEHGLFRIEARIEADTRLNGTLRHDDAAGDLRLTKWTFRP